MGRVASQEMPRRDDQMDIARAYLALMTSQARPQSLASSRVLWAIIAGVFAAVWLSTLGL